MQARGSSLLISSRFWIKKEKNVEEAMESYSPIIRKMQLQFPVDKIKESLDRSDRLSSNVIDVER